MARVLDLTGHAGVYATRLMVEAGHDVIRIESPAGDDLRRSGPFLAGVPDIEDGAYHQFFNAGKRSLALDLTTADGREAFERLVRTASVVVASAPLPIDEERLRALRPDVVLVVIAGAERPELCAYARAGLLALTGQPGSAPVLMGGHIVYAATGTWVMVAAAAAMLVQEISGEGQTVTVDIQDCLETFLDHAVENFTARGRPTERRGQRGAVTPISGAFPSEDGFWLLSLHDSRERWETLMEWMQDPVLGDDESLLNYDERLKHCDMILDRIGNWARGFPKQDLVAEAQRRRIPCAPVNTSLELAADEQLIGRGFLVEREHPVHGAMLFPRGALATVLDSEVGFAPKLGSANRALLGELGYTREEQAMLFERSIS